MLLDPKLKLQLILIQKDVIVRSLDVKRNIANATKQGWNVEIIVNVKSAKMVSVAPIKIINRNPKIIDTLIQKIEKIKSYLKMLKLW